MDVSTDLPIPISVDNTLCSTYEELSAALSERCVDDEKPSLAEIFHRKFCTFPLLSRLSLTNSSNC